jgi:AraC family ethanolamine operon transcriptional activator
MAHPIAIDAPAQGYARTQAVTVHQTYGDVLPAWVQAVQLGSGQPLLEHREVAFPGMEVAYVASAVANIEHYTIPEGETHFSLDLAPDAPILSWTGHESVRSARQAIAIHRSNVEYIGVTPPGWRCFYLCMNNALVDRLELLPPAVWKKSQNPQEALLGFDVLTLDRFRQFIQAWFAPFAHPHQFTTFTPVQAATLWMELTETLQLLFSLSEVGREAFMFDQPSRRYRHFRDACAWIESHLDQPLTVDQLAAALHIAPRSLQYAFQDIAGVSVAKYIQARRLHAVRETLLSPKSVPPSLRKSLASPASPPEMTLPITQIARRYGFIHLGRFSQKFYQQFGLFPHELRSLQHS